MMQKSFGERLRQKRKEKELTLKNIARSMNVTEATVSRYETGRISGMSFESLILLADRLGCSTDYLLGREDKNEKEEKLSDAHFNRKDMSLIKAYYRLTEDQQALVDRMLGL